MSTPIIDTIDRLGNRKKEIHEILTSYNIPNFPNETLAELYPKVWLIKDNYWKQYRTSGGLIENDDSLESPLFEPAIYGRSVLEGGEVVGSSNIKLAVSDDEDLVETILLEALIPDEENGHSFSSPTLHGFHQYGHPLCCDEVTNDYLIRRIGVITEINNDTPEYSHSRPGGTTSIQHNITIRPSTNWDYPHLGISNYEHIIFHTDGRITIHFEWPEYTLQILPTKAQVLEKVNSLGIKIYRPLPEPEYIPTVHRRGYSYFGGTKIEISSDGTMPYVNVKILSEWLLEIYDSPIVESGKFNHSDGMGAIWKLSFNGTLYVEKDPDNGGNKVNHQQQMWNSPWNNHRESIFNIHFERGLNCSNTAYLFNNLTQVETIHLNGLTTAGATNMTQMFTDCNNLRSIDLSSFDTSSVAWMTSMFRNCSTLTNLNLLSFNTSNVTNMDNIFRNANSLEIIIQSFNMSKVTDASRMFMECYNLKSVDVSNWDVSSVIWAHFLFNNCYRLTNIDVSRWDTSSFASLERTFYGCNDVEYLDVSNWDVSSVIWANYLFGHCHKVQSFPVGNWDTSNVTTMQATFENCWVATDIPVGNWDTSKVTNINKTFDQCYQLEAIDLSNWVVNNVTVASYFARNCPVLQNLDIGHWRFPVLSNCDGMFRECRAMTYIPCEDWGMERLHDANGMFLRTAIHSMDLSRWRIERLNSIASFLSNCPNLTSVNLTWPNLPNLEIISGLFNMSYALTDITGVEDWYVPNLRLASQVFGNTPLTSIDISSWRPNAIELPRRMFSNCRQLTHINLGDIDFGHAYDMSDMFNSCEKLTHVDTSMMDTSNAEDFTTMFNNTNIQHLDISTFDTRKGAIFQNMLNSGFSSIKVGENFRIGVPYSNAERITSQGYRLRNVGTGTIDNPLGEHIFTGQQFHEFYHQNSLAETWVRVV